MKIEFIPSSKEVELVVPRPQPAKKYLPKYFLEMERFRGGKPKIDAESQPTSTLKGCMPFYDAISSGYIQETWCEIKIDFFEEDNQQKVRYVYASDPPIISLRDFTSIEIDNSYHPFEFVWQMPWVPRVPSGWSVLFRSPSNRLDLPFYSLDGIIDSDKFHFSAPGNYPFYLKKTSNTIFIPKGTPMYQLIPLKRENWESFQNKFEEEEYIKMKQKINSVFFSGYQKFFHSKKRYT